ncbi:MAG: hypothetical protein Q9168_003490 [Polycauliona sp. 1 TL-2023]
MVQTFLHVAIPAPTPALFPFEKLTPELQRMVIREALPNHSLQPSRPPSADWAPGVALRAPPKGRHIGASNYWDLLMNDYWSEEKEESFDFYLRSLKDSTNEKEVRDPKAALNLLLVSKTFNTVTRSLYDTEIPFVINITWMCFHFLERVVNKNFYYPTYTADLPHYPHFRQLHNFELNFNHDDDWWRSYLGDPLDRSFCSWTNRIDRSEPIWWKLTKQWIQVIGNELAKNKEIEKLTVCLPCLCGLMTPKHLEKAKNDMLDLLEPLKQVKVGKGIKFVWLHYQDTKEGRAAYRIKGSRVHICYTKGLGGELLKILQAEFDTLNGENSSVPQEV